ncbi:MAG: insulinase family protein [Deltaproteobacteria bacterium]|nr:insulinase family protein [Deltaproteobacteria bacterium]
MSLAQVEMKSRTQHFCVTFLLLYLVCAVLAFETFASDRFPRPEQLKYPRLEFKLPQAERIPLKNGALLFFLRDDELPLVSISALVRTGSMYDPQGKEGVAELTAYLMRTGGTEKLSSAEIDDRLDFLAAAPSIAMALESASINFSFLKDDLDACLDLLAQMIKEPAFEEDKLQLALSLKREELRRITDNPQKLAFREFNRLLYPDDPRGRYPTFASLQNIRRDDLVSFQRKYFTASNMIFAVSGNISRQDAVNKMEQYFSDWGTALPALAIAPPPKRSDSGLFIIRKQIPQSTAVSGEFTLSKNDPDFYAFTILDFIIGSGGFSSRIFSAIRNNEGLAYSAGSFYRARANYGVFGTYAMTKTESTIQAIQLINDILQDVAGGSVSLSELDSAKRSILNSFIFSFVQPSQIASQQMSIAFEKLPDDFLSGYRKRIEAVTREDLKRVAARALNEKKRMTVIVGDVDRFGKIPERWGQPVYLSP